LHLTHRGIHAQDRGDARIAHGPGLPPARPCGQSRWRTPPGHARYRHARPGRRRLAVAEDPLVVAEGITKRFARGVAPAIDHLSTRIEPGRVSVLVGPDA